VKIALSAGARGLDARVSPVFGRCQYFTIVEVEGEQITSDETIENAARDQTRGAGSSAAQILAEKEVDVLITDKVGSTSFMALQQLNIDIYKKSAGTVEENVKQFISGGLSAIESATTGAGRRTGF
jgi:predicted Fe-Mo cluster-binding NifX family protein